jgi:type II secretory pathway predicted ATPase ExeA
VYETFYNLELDPFMLSPDPYFSFRHPSYVKAMTYVTYGLERAEGIVMITGKPGTGKTLLVNELIASTSFQSLEVANLVSTQLLADDLLRMVAFAFKLDIEEKDKATILNQLARFFEQSKLNGKRCLLIVDEAQDLPECALEELRLLTNLQNNIHPLLQIVLIGQDQLKEKIKVPELEQLWQRLIAVSHLEPLNENETREYIEHRLKRAGWENNPIFKQEIYPYIYTASQGVPRLINKICSRLMLNGFADGKYEFDQFDIQNVINELKEELLISQQQPFLSMVV